MTKTRKTSLIEWDHVVNAAEAAAGVTGRLPADRTKTACPRDTGTREPAFMVLKYLEGDYWKDMQRSGNIIRTGREGGECKCASGQK